MRDKILELIEQKSDLPPIPDIVMRLQAKINDPKSSITDISKLIEIDPVLSGKILKLSNSSFYSRGSKPITTLPMAINKIGLKEIVKLVYSIKLSGLFIDSKLLDRKQFWKHSLAVGIFTQTLCRLIDATPEEQEIAYLAGIMHDLGIMVFSYIIPEEYSEFLKEIVEKEEPIEKLEKEKFGIDHPELGSVFIKKWWKIDDRITTSVKNHHFPFEGNALDKMSGQLVNVANGACNTFGIYNGVNCYKGVFLDGAWDNLGLSLDKAEKIIEEIKIAINQAEELISK